MHNNRRAMVDQKPKRKKKEKKGEEYSVVGNALSGRGEALLAFKGDMQFKKRNL